MIAYVTYSLCVLTSMVCAVLLLRGYARTKARLTLWCALCFVGLALNNILLVVDKATPTHDLSVARTIPALVGLCLLIYGLVWDSR
jgi:hypothetical protein